MNKKKLSFSGLWKILKMSGSGFIDDKVMKLSGSLSFYMVFSLGPLLLIVITMCGVFFGKDAVEGKIYSQLQGFVGHDTAVQLQQIIRNAAISGKNVFAAVIGIIFLLVGATSVFGEMQDSINSIWGLKAKPKRGWLKFLLDRVLSFSVIVSLGFLLLVSLGISALIELFSARLQGLFPGVRIVFFWIVNLILTMGITCFIFGIVFKVLPDARIKWKDVLAGAILTTLLFLLGKFGISYYIAKSHIGTTYGPAGSLVVLLLWVYYSAMILYFGAEFTKAYAIEYGSEILPNDYAVTIKQVEVETTGESVQATLTKSKTIPDQT